MKTIKISFTGDAILNELVLNRYKKSKFDMDLMFDDLKNFFENSDYVITNLETPISSNKEEWTSSRYQFTSPPEFAKSLINNGVTCFTLANNHCLDNGIDGINKTIEELDKLKIDYVGIGNKKNLVIDIKGVRLGILSYTYGTNAFANNVYLDKNQELVCMFQRQELSNSILRKIWNSKNIFVKIIRKICKILHLFQFNKNPYERYEKNAVELKKIDEQINLLKAKNVDHIIMCMHEGGQYNSKVQTKTKKTVQKILAKNINIIIGNHEHVIHNVEHNSNSVISYSLGNLISSFGVIEEPIENYNDYSIILNLYLTSKSIEKVTYTIVKIHDENNIIKSSLLYDLIENEHDTKVKESLINDYYGIQKIVSNSFEKEIKKEIEL